MIRILDNFQPFNDVFFKSCFYNSLFPVILHFNKSIMPFFVNDIVKYTYEPSTGQIGIDHIYIENDSKVLERMGIRINEKTYSNDIIKDAIESLTNTRPVIIWVDCYYESIRSDTYLKASRPHTLLIYGFNDLKGIFNIIEHMNGDTLTYKKQIISYTDVVNAYKGYNANYPPRQMFSTYFEFFPDDGEKNECLSISKDILICALSRNIINSHDSIVCGLENIKIFSTRLQSTLFNECRLKQSAPDLIKSFNSVISAKKIEKYRIANLLGQVLDVMDLLDSIIKNWEDSRAAIARFMYSSIYRSDSMHNILTKIDDIYKSEYEYNYKLACLLRQSQII